MDSSAGNSEKKFVSVEELQALPKIQEGIMVSNTDLFTSLDYSTQEKVEETLRSFVSEKE